MSLLTTEISAPNQPKHEPSNILKSQSFVEFSGLGAGSYNTRNQVAYLWATKLVSATQDKLFKTLDDLAAFCLGTNLAERANFKQEVFNYSKEVVPKDLIYRAMALRVFQICGQFEKSAALFGQIDQAAQDARNFCLGSQLDSHVNFLLLPFQDFPQQLKDSQISNLSKLILLLTIGLKQELQAIESAEAQIPLTLLRNMLSAWNVVEQRCDNLVKLGQDLEQRSYEKRNSKLNLQQIIDLVAGAEFW